MDATREAEELVRLWQELQAAQVSGDRGRLGELARLAESRAGRPGASSEWQLLAREAGRQAGHVDEQQSAMPTAGVDAAATTGERDLDGGMTAPDAELEPEGEGEPAGRGRGLAGLIWVVLLAGYLILQFVGNLADGG